MAAGGDHDPRLTPLIRQPGEVRIRLDTDLSGDTDRRRRLVPHWIYWSAVSTLGRRSSPLVGDWNP
jgi:hypothetical protein